MKNNGDQYSASGMSVRSQFASMALQGLLSGRRNGTSEGDHDWLVKNAVKLADLLFIALNEKSKESYLDKYSYELPFMVRSEFGLDCLINITPGSPRSRLKCVIEGLPEIGMDICEDNLALFANGVPEARILDPVKEVYSALRHEILKVTFGRCAAEIRELIDPNSMDGDMSVLGGVR